MPDHSQIISRPEDHVQEILHVDEAGRPAIQRLQRCDGIIEAAHAVPGVLGKMRDMRYNGSIPIVVAAIWAKECGAAIGSREFMEYAKRKLQDSDNKKLLVQRF